MNDDKPVNGSFRDPSGFLFSRNDKLYRQVNQVYQRDYDFLLSSGLYKNLVTGQLLIPHIETNAEAALPAIAYKVIKPEQLSFISYPYEWSFSQLKDAALTTLRIQQRAVKYGMTLKDASAYNIQFHKGKPILIDTLSFEIYEEGNPWIAYKQFCQHFLGPLALMAKKDIRLGQLLRVYIDGIPLDLSSRLLPSRTRFNFGLAAHIHLHAQALLRYANNPPEKPPQSRKMSKQSLLGLIENIEKTITNLEWRIGGTEWENYYSITNYTDAAFIQKKEIVSNWINRVGPQSLWDLGANNGFFTRLATGNGINSISFDGDPAAVEQNYKKMKLDNEKNILPLVLDLTNPSPSMGWHGRERQSLTERSPADMILALALIHHLAISNNVPLQNLAEFFHDLGRWLIIEFVPKSDSQVQKMLKTRVDIFNNYSESEFENVFEKYFFTRDKAGIRESERHLYLLEKR